MFEWEIVNNSTSNMNRIIQLLVNTEVVYIHGSFGDVYLQTALVAEYNRNEEKRYAIMIDEKYKQFCEKLIKNSTQIFFINGNQILNVLSENKIFGKVHGLPTRLLPTVYPYIAEAISLGKLSYIDFLRIVLKNKNNGKIEALEKYNAKELILEAKKIIEKENLNVGKTILLSCENNTHQEFEDELWLKIIEIIKSKGLEPCLNASGTLLGKYQKLRNSQIKRIEVPPYLITSIVDVCGGYIVGTNGFQTIQGLFNEKTMGIHLINNYNGIGVDVEDKFGNHYDISILALSKQLPEQFQNKQIELSIEKNINFNEIEKSIEKMIKENISLVSG